MAQLLVELCDVSIDDPGRTTEILRMMDFMVNRAARSHANIPHKLPTVAAPGTDRVCAC
jgi:hypothetical protein